MPEKNIGLVGLGYWGKNILRNLYELGALHTACDADDGILSERKQKFPDAVYTSSFKSLLDNPEIKAIAVVTPAATHYSTVRDALRAGKDVFVEKPLALTVKEGAALARIAGEEGRVLMVGHILQYHPAVIGLKKLISGGALGKIQYIYSNRLNIGKLRTEENILWSFAPHDISVILMLMGGEEPMGVEAFGGDYLSNGVYDTTITELKFSNGVNSHIFVSWLHPFKEQKLVVVGSKAMAVFDDVSEEKLFLYPHEIEWKEGKVPVAKKADYQVIRLEKREPLKEELLHFMERIQDRKTPDTDSKEGLRVLKVLERAERSLSEKRGVPKAGKETDFFVHESAYVDEGAEIGEGSRIWHFSHVLKGSRIGKNCIVAQNVMIGPDVEIGDRCKVQNNVALYKGIKIEDEVFCGPSCVFTNVYNPRAFVERKNEFLPTVIKRGATIGANATIVCGTTLGEYCLIGAGAVVKKDVQPYSLMAGVPARRIGWVCKCGVPLKEFNAGAASCPRCGSAYRQNDDGVYPVKETI